MVIKKFIFFRIGNIKSLKIFFFKIVDFYLIVKLNNIINFCLYKYKIVIIIFTAII